MNNKKFKLVLVGIMLYTLVFTALCSLRYRAIFSFEWEDEAAENQILWNTAKGNFLKQTIYETESGIFIDHFNPIYILIAFLYAIYPRIYTLCFLISLGFALGAIPLYLISRKIFNDEFIACFLSFTYLFYSPLHWINFTVIEPLLFSIPFLLFTFYFFYERRFVLYMIFLLLSLMIKENMALIVIMMGLYALLKRRKRKWIVWPIFSGLVWFILSVWVIYPLIGAPMRSTFHPLIFGGPIEIAKNLFLFPQRLAEQVFSKEHIIFFIRIFKPIFGLCFLSAEWLIALPTYLEILLVEGLPGNEWSYSLAPAIPFIFLGLIFSLAKIQKFIWSLKKLRVKTKTFLMNCLVVCLLGSSFASNFGVNLIGFFNSGEIEDRGFLAVRNIYDKRFITLGSDGEIAWDLIRQIPDDASVSASGDLLVPLSHRKKLLEFGFDEEDDGGGYDYFDVDYIIINKKHKYFGAGNYAHIKQGHLDGIAKLVNEQKFFIVCKRGNFILLKRVNNKDSEIIRMDAPWQ